jgi:serine/threonine-protein kinase HipA
MANKCLYCYESLDGTDDFHAKCSMEFFGTTTPPSIGFTFNQMVELAKEVVQRSVTIPGVQPKLSMSILKDSPENIHNRLTVVGALGGRFILKPPTVAFPEMPENEHVTMRIAASFGIRVVPSCLIQLASGERSYLTRRVDRTDFGEKIHMLDMFQITEAFDKYTSSLEKVGKALDQFSSNTLLDKILFFELSVFAFLTGNNDMHLKNFSMIEGPSGWTLSPAYDLLNVSVLNPDDSEELALTLCGKKKKIRREHFEQLAKSLGLADRQIQGVFSRMIKSRPSAMEWIDKSFLSEPMKDAYKQVLNTRFEQLGLSS